MIVYSTTLWFSNITDFFSIKKVIGLWLNTKSKSKTSIKKPFKEIECVEDFPKLYSLSFEHPDEEVKGRRWITEIGVKQNTISEEIECSILLHTSEISTRVNSVPASTRPKIVWDLIKKCNPTTKTAGIKIHQLDENSAENFIRFIVKDKNRVNPIVIISPTKDCKYLVSSKELHFQLAGLAEIYEIPVTANTLQISKTVGDTYSAWHGAINIIFPYYQKDFPFIKRIKAEEIEEVLSGKKDIKREILSIITHRTNLPFSRRHISPQVVLNHKKSIEFQLEREEIRKQIEHVGTQKELADDLIGLYDNYEKEYKEVISKLQEKNNLLENENFELAEEKEELEKEINNLNFKISNLEHLLEQANDKKLLTSKNPNHLDNKTLISFFNKQSDLLQTLKVINMLFNDRIVVLPSAWKSAREAIVFRYKDKAIDLLWKLASDYWDLMSSKKGSDAKAINEIFGNTVFAPRESEIVESNNRGLNLRTFEYKNKPIVMMKHLKIGVKESVAETLRIHFEWDAHDKKVVIGHCGKHLDHS